MNKEEILAKSKQENRGQDIANLEAAKSAMQIGWTVVICLLAAVSVVDAIVLGRLNYECFFALMAGSCVIFAVKYVKMRKKHELVLALLYAAAAVAFLIGWILQLAK